MRPVLLTGCNGQVGAEIRRALAGATAVVACGRDELDLADADAIVKKVRSVNPALIINAAAYTAVDRAEAESADAHAVNAKAPGILAEEAKRLDALLVHYSTDYVFDGGKVAPYDENDVPDPLNAYGRSKLAGERAVAATGAAHLIFRTSWVYGARGSNFLLTILKLAAERDELKVVNDQHGAPTWSRDLAVNTLAVLKAVNANAPCFDGIAAKFRDRGGVYHMTAAGQTTWFGFAQALLALRSPVQRQAKLTPIPGSDYLTAARRPANSVLDNRKLRANFGIALPRWEDSLKKCMTEMGAAV